MLLMAIRTFQVKVATSELCLFLFFQYQSLQYNLKWFLSLGMQTFIMIIIYFIYNLMVLKYMSVTPYPRPSICFPRHDLFIIYTKNWVPIIFSINRVQSSVSRLHSERDKAVAELDKAREELERTQATLGKAQLQQDKLQASLDAAHSEIDKLQEKLDKAATEVRKVSDILFYKYFDRI